MITLYHASNTEFNAPKIGNGEAHGAFAGAVTGIFSAAFSAEVALEYGATLYAFEIEEAGDEIAFDSYDSFQNAALEGDLPAVAIIKNWAGDEIAITDLSRIENFRRA